MQNTNIRIHELASLRRDERESEPLNKMLVNTQIDMKTVEDALRDIEDQEIEFYNEMHEIPDELIEEAMIHDMINSLSDDDFDV